MTLRPYLAAAVIVALGGCATMQQGPSRATAKLAMADGAPAGKATVTETKAGLRLTIAATGLTAGLHGIHVHAIGKCEGPKFASAGGHWNPDALKHGLDNPDGHHAGDMPNLKVGANGKGALTTLLPGATLAGLLDGDGGALVVHAGMDDQKTDPSGNSGDRIACGVFSAG